MTLTPQTLLFISYILNVYIVSFTIIFGLIGNILNTLVFTQLKLFHRNPSAFSLTIVSIADCCMLILTSITHVTASIFHFNLATTSRAGCKLPGYIARLAGVISISVVCFAAFDQYLSTNYFPRLRQMSTFKLAQRFISILLPFTILYSIPVLIYVDIYPVIGCSIIDSSFSYFNSFVHYCILFGILPIIFSLSFSLLAYQNVRRLVRHQIPLVRRRLDRQLTAMILVRAALMIITTSPFVIYLIYQYNNSYDRTNPFTVAIYQLIATSVTTILYINYSSSFYFFILTSSRFRRQAKHFLIKRIWRKCLSIHGNRIEVIPEHQIPTVESHMEN